MTTTIFHNPACGTSRNTLALIRNCGVQPLVVEYLKTPPGRAKLVELVTPLSTRLCRPSEVVLDILPSAQLAPFAKEDGEPIIDAKGRRVTP